jgi:hypothetical protein
MRGERLTQAEGQKAKAGKLRRRAGQVSFWLLCGVIAAVSILDASLVVAMQTTPEMEQNPMGSAIIRDSGQWGLFWAKMFGTTAVIVVLAFLYKIRPPAAYLAAGTLAVFQLLLLVYLFS